MPPSEIRDRARVLIVDDDEQIRELLSRLMAHAGLVCDTAATAGEARAALGRLRPDLLLLDVYLPDENGLTLAREVAALPAGPAVLMVSGEDDASVARIALDAGAFGYVTKPFKRNEVAIAVDHALRRRDVERESRARRFVLEDAIVERAAAVQDALSRARLAQDETVLRLAQAMELRDPATGSHTERMSAYCAVLGERFGLDPVTFQAASRLHDIGKIALGDALLCKPGALTAAERAQVERHPAIGHELLSGTRSTLLEMAAQIAWTHHERFDGHGYPRGLAGDDIPLPGRIAAVADVFDALTSDRVYRPAVSTEDALGVLVAERGGHFDPDVVDAFVASLEEVLIIGEQCPATSADDPRPAFSTTAGTDVLTLHEAAEAIGVSASTMRRWADAGRVPAIRTPGGHRRFLPEGVRRVVEERSPRARVEPIAPPTGPLPSLAAGLRGAGMEMASTVSAGLYRTGPAGWFADRDAAAPIRSWVAGLVASSETGRHEAALAASEALMRRADLCGTTLLERHGFLERFGEVAVRAISRAQAPHSDVVGTRRLFASMQQRLLAAC
jgi:putative two-component system response regulator